MTAENQVTGTDALEQLLQDGRRFGSEYKAGLSNHLPMALIALHRLGADAERLQAFFDKYSLRLELKEAESTEILKTNWTESLGQHRFDAGYVAFFRRHLAEQGVSNTLTTFLPRLLTGVGGGAFHPLIRLAYALEVSNEAETAEALAAWSTAYLYLGEPLDTAATLLSTLETLRADSAMQAYVPSGNSIFERLKNIAAQPAFLGMARYPSGFGLEALREAALRVYAGSKDNFTALHLLTSTHALRVVRAHAASVVDDALRYYWLAFAAAYVSIAMPEAVEVSRTASSDWPQIVEAAIPSRDDHVIKLVYTCREEAAAYDDDRYRVFAAKKAGL